MIEVCRICHRPGVHRRPGRVVAAGSGWGIQRWQDSAPLFENLGSKSEAYKLLYAMQHGWAAVTVRFVNGSTQTFNLQEFWSRAVQRDPRPPLVIHPRKGASANAPHSDRTVVPRARKFPDHGTAM